MFCDHCGAELQKNINYCHKCGATLYQPDGCTNSTQVTPVFVDKPIRGRQNYIAGKSMKWFNFFVDYLIWIWIIVGIIQYLIQVSKDIDNTFENSIIKYYTDPIIGTYNVLILIGLIVTTLLCVLTFILLSNYQKNGYFAVIALLIIRPVWPIICYLSILKYIEITSILVSFMLLAAFSVINIVYFYRRRSIFVN